MIKIGSIQKVLLLVCALLFMCDTADAAFYSLKKVKKLYARKKYQKVLAELRLLEKARFVKNGRLNFSLRDVAYYLISEKELVKTHKAEKLY